MKEKFLTVLAATTDGTGIAYGIANIKEVLGVIVLVVSLFSTVLLTTLKVIDWYKKSKDPNSKGGEKITIDEIKEGIETIKEGIDTIKEETEKAKDKND